MDYGLTGKVAVVNAASRGLGFASAYALAQEGCRLAIVSRNTDAIRDAARRLANETGAEVIAQAVDVTDAKGIASFAHHVGERFGGCDILVTNSGGPKPGTFDSLDDADFTRAHELLVLSAIRMSKAFLPLLRASDQARIISLTSTSVREILPNLMLSNAIRSAVVGWSKTLARELAPEGITVNCVAPGIIDTERIAELITAQAANIGISEDEQRQLMLAAQPSGRFGQPQEFAHAVCFLASRGASYISGTTLYVDGALMRTVI